MQQALVATGGQATRGSAAGWRHPTREERAKGGSPDLMWRGKRGVFRVFEAVTRIGWLGRQWSSDERGWCMRVDPVKGVTPSSPLPAGGFGFPAWAGPTEADARATCEALDRLMTEGVSLATLYEAQRFWADEYYDETTREEQARAEREVRAHGWFWPEEPRDPKFDVPGPAPRPSWAFAVDFPASHSAQPWADVGCPACGAVPGDPCRGVFRKGTEPFHLARAREARDLWEESEDARSTRGVHSAEVGAKLVGAPPLPERARARAVDAPGPEPLAIQQAEAQLALF